MIKNRNNLFIVVMFVLFISIAIGTICYFYKANDKTFHTKENINIDVSDYVGKGNNVSSMECFSNTSKRTYVPDKSSIYAILKTLIRKDFKEVSSTDADGEYSLSNKVLQTEDSTITLFYDYQGILVQVVVQKDGEPQSSYLLEYSDVRGQMATGFSNEQLDKMLEEDKAKEY